MRRLLSIAAVVAAACSSVTPSPPLAPATAVPPTPSVDIVEVSGGVIDLTVFDDTGLLIDASPKQDGSDTPEPEAIADGERVVVSWNSGACNDPVLRLTGSADDLHLILQSKLSPEPDPGFECPAELRFAGVVLTLSEPVEQDAITLVSD